MENCYFWIDSTLPEEKQCIETICLDCFEKYQQGWFWNGSEKGYGPFDYICDKCSKIIHKGIKDD